MVLLAEVLYEHKRLRVHCVQMDHSAEKPTLAWAALWEGALDALSWSRLLLAIEKVAQLKGRDPDRPRLLKKVTETM